MQKATILNRDRGVAPLEHNSGRRLVSALSCPSRAPARRVGATARAAFHVFQRRQRSQGRKSRAMQELIPMKSPQSSLKPLARITFSVAIYSLLRWMSGNAKRDAGMGGRQQSNGSQWAAVFCLASQMSIVDRSPQTNDESCSNKLQLIGQPKKIVIRLNLGHPRHGPPVFRQPLCLGMRIH